VRDCGGCCFFLESKEKKKSDGKESARTGGGLKSKRGDGDRGTCAVTSALRDEKATRSEGVPKWQKWPDFGQKRCQAQGRETAGVVGKIVAAGRRSGDQEAYCPRLYPGGVSEKYSWGS